MPITPPMAVMLLVSAAGNPPINTEVDPMTIVSGCGGTPLQSTLSVTLAAGKPPISTLGAPLIIIPPVCGIGGTPGVINGHVDIVVMVTALGILVGLVSYYNLQ